MKPERAKKRSYTKKEFRKLLNGQNTNEIYVRLTNGSPNTIHKELGIPYSNISTTTRKVRKLIDTGVYSDRGRSAKFNVYELRRLKEHILANSTDNTTIRSINVSFEARPENERIRNRQISLSSYYNTITSKKYLNMSYKRTKKYCIYHDEDMNIRLERKAFAKRLLYLLSKRL